MTEPSLTRPVTAEELYLSLLRRSLTGVLSQDPALPRRAERGPGLRGTVHRAVERWLAGRGLELVRRQYLWVEARAAGKDWPATAETMVGLRRLEQLEECVVRICKEDVPGDLIETGVWRGGTVIFMRGILKAYGDLSRTVWVADSFQGLPKPDAERYPADAGGRHWAQDDLAVSEEQVRANFVKYELLDEQVRFLPGWFRDTLPSAPIERLSVLRLDGDMYESSMVALESLYDKVSPGGYVIVDDYGAVPACKAAVDEFRGRRGISDDIVPIDWTGVYWRLSEGGAGRRAD